MSPENIKFLLLSAVFSFKYEQNKLFITLNNWSSQQFEFQSTSLKYFDK